MRKSELICVLCLCVVVFCILCFVFSLCPLFGATPPEQPPYRVADDPPIGSAQRAQQRSAHSSRARGIQNFNKEAHLYLGRAHGDANRRSEPRRFDKRRALMASIATS